MTPQGIVNTVFATNPPEILCKVVQFALTTHRSPRVTFYFLPRWGSLLCSLHPLAGFVGPNSKGRQAGREEKKKKWEGKEKGGVGT